MDNVEHTVTEIDIEWDDISYVISSRYRVAVLKRLAKGPATPSLIAEQSNAAIAHISRALQELRDRSLVTLLVSEKRKKGRVYGMTDKASAEWKIIMNQQLV